TVASVEPTIAGIRIGATGTATARKVGIIAVAVRPRVIRSNRHAAGRATLKRKQHAVIAARSCIDILRNVRHGRALDTRIIEEELAPRIEVPRVGTRSGSGESKLSGDAIAGNVDRRITLLITPQMRSLAAHVSSRHKPVCTHLSLNAEIPRIFRYRFTVFAHG